jgi:hypothetical protein
MRLLTSASQKRPTLAVGLTGENLLFAGRSRILLAGGAMKEMDRTSTNHSSEKGKP